MNVLGKNKLIKMKNLKQTVFFLLILFLNFNFCDGQSGLEEKPIEVMNSKGTQLTFGTPESVDMDSTFLHQKIDSIAQEAIEAKAFPGMQVLIAKSGKVIFHKAYGYHTYENEKDVQLTDLYDFASVSKVTTALPALMKLHGEGKFGLDQPFKTYFPKFKKSNKSDLTYREILAHQAGLKPWIPYWTTTIKRNGKYKWRTLKNKQTKNYNIKITDNLFLHKKYKKRIYKAIYKSPVSEVKEYKYSGLAFYLFPEIVADLTKMDFETYLKKEIYEPIGATTLTYNPERFFPKERIIPTERDTFFRKIQIHGTVHDEGAIMMGGVSANAGLFGTATDLAKLMQLYLNGGSYGDQRIIAQESIDEFTKYQFTENNNRRGLGFDKPLLEYDSVKSSVAKDASPASYGHSGYTGTFVWVDPEYELIYIFFSNRVFPTRNNRKIYEMNVRPNIQQVIYDSIKK
jgi:beta-N-acetylhexosaminidase